jgi:hypothetical protein
MTQLDDTTRRALLAVDDPPRGMQEHIYRAIMAGGPPPDGGHGEPGFGGPASGGAMDVGFAAKVVGATIGMTSAGLALLMLTSAGIRAVNRAERERERVVVEDRRAGESKPASAVVESDPLEATSVAIEPTPAIVAREDREPSATTDSEPESPSSTLEAELALMKQAREARSPAVTLALLEQHRDEFTDGVLTDEREVMRIEALCALGRADEAEQAAALFVAAKPAHPLRSRVEPACPN